MLRKAVCVVVVAVVAGPAGGAERKALLDVTADVGLTSVAGKKTFSNGIGPTTPIMQNQNWSGFENKDLLMAFDTKAVRGWSIRKATLHLWLAKGDLYGVGLCTVLAEWTEGKGLNWVAEAGSPCWDFIHTPEPGTAPSWANYWAWPGSAFHSVCWSHPAARYSHAGPGQLKRKKGPAGRFVRLSIPVEAKLVESLAAGLATGLVLTDDKGQVRESYSLVGGAKPYRYNAAEDAYVFTREVSDGRYRPKLEVVGEPVDETAPAAPAKLKVVSADEDSVRIEFVAPGDDGEAGTVLGYEAAVSAERVTSEAWKAGRAAPLPRWAMPKPVAGGKLQRFPVFTLSPGNYHLGIRGVDEAGNRGEVANVWLTVPKPASAALAKVRSISRRKVGPVASPKGEPSVYACPDMVQVDPVTGWTMVDGEQYRLDDVNRANPVWDPVARTVELTAAANEVVAFQLILGMGGKPLSKVQVAVGDLEGGWGRKIAAEDNIETFRLWYVSGDPEAARSPRATEELHGSTWHGGGCLPLREPYGETFDLPAKDSNVVGQKYQSVWVDVYVPRKTARGPYRGEITISADELAKPMKLELVLNVLPIRLPDEPNWVIELNRYHGLAGWAGAGRDAEAARRATWDCHRLARKHRGCLIALPYSHSGRVDREYVPVMEGKGTGVRIKDWTDYDKLMGPLLDGSAFTAESGYTGPGQGLPLHHMYTPFHEAWPMPVNKDTYADWMAVKDRLEFAEYARKARRPHESFSKAYKAGFKAVAKDFFEHFQDKAWTRTYLHLYNNNKYYWKVAYFRGMGRGGASFWLMDEPTDFDDYDANAFIMGLGLAAHRESKARDVRVVGRVDVSQPDMARGLWDNIATVWCIGGFRNFATTNVARRRWLPDERHVGYGGGTRVGQAPVGLMQASLARWCVGYEGWMPWWNCFYGGWDKADDLAILHSGGNVAGRGGYVPPMASVRLKHTRRCQQDMEYLHVLAGTRGWDRHRVRRALAAYADDPRAPVLTFGNLTYEKMLELRRRVVATILATK